MKNKNDWIDIFLRVAVLSANAIIAIVSNIQMERYINARIEAKTEEKEE